jgi:hypothetical protein
MGFYVDRFRLTRTEPAGRTADRKGKPVMIKLEGKVEAFYR